MSLGAVADAELDYEVDRKAHEQHEERDRDEIERAHKEEPEGGRISQAANHRDQGC